MVDISDLPTSNNLVELLLKRADARGQAPFLWAKRDGKWQPISWAEAAQRICLLAEGLRAIGLKPGDRIMLVSENRPEWCLTDFAIMAAGCVTVPAYVTNTERDHLHILEDSGASAVIVSNDKLAKPLIGAVLRSGKAKHVIGIEPLRIGQQGMFQYHDWQHLIAGDGAAARAAVATRIAAITRDEIACLIYTSGTGGAPRGVMLHHGSMLMNVHGAGRILSEDFGLGEDEAFLSFLPLSHAYEHTGGQMLPIGVGAQIYYSEGLEKLASNIEEVRPTVMVVVPRLFEVLRARIMKQIEKQGAFASYLLDRAIGIGTMKAQGRRGGKGRLRDTPMDLLLDRTLRPKIRARFGGRLKAMVSGGAPLSPEVGVFFESMGLTMLQGYGQTEAGPVISCNRPRAGLKMDTVGPPLDGVTVKIAEDGEILVQGELVMKGYWRNPDETDRTLVDGWLHTGDIGHIDKAGRIVITDRKKDMIVNDKGDNVSPARVEGLLALQPEIGQAMVVGDRRPYVVGLIVPDAEWALDWARSNGEKLQIAELQKLPAFRSAIRAAIDRVNQDLSVIEKVRQFAFADEPFTIENEEMTPKQSIRRHKLKARYGERLDALYKS